MGIPDTAEIHATEFGHDIDDGNNDPAATDQDILQT